MVIGALFDLFLSRGAPEYVRSDNGPEFTAREVWKWLTNMGAMMLFIEPGSPWENGYVESFNGKMRDELLNGGMFDTLQEAKVIVGGWVNHYNKVRPHSALGRFRLSCHREELQEDDGLQGPLDHCRRA